MLDVTEDGERFSLPEYGRLALTGYHRGNMAHMARLLATCSSASAEVEKCFPTDGPSGKCKPIAACTAARPMKIHYRLLYTPLQCSAVQCSAMQCSAVQCIAVQCMMQGREGQCSVQHEGSAGQS